MPLPRCFLALLLLLGGVVARGEFVMVWELGKHDYQPYEFGGEDNVTNAAPGSATAADDDFYLAGVYPAPINAVATKEPETNFERSLTSSDPTNRIHFQLNATQAGAMSMIRVHVYVMWGGWEVNEVTQKDFGDQQLRVRINGHTVLTKSFNFEQMITVSATQAEAGLVEGENVIELTRSGGAASGWYSLDWLSCEVNPEALEDGDHDGLPRWWEEDHGLSDASAADALLDPDHDGLTNAQEFAAKTDPNNPDTDGDGLLDGAETTSSPLLADTDGDGLGDAFELSQVPPLNPNNIDTDGDGVPDGWEVRTGFSATNNKSIAPAFAGAVGIKFVNEMSPECAIGRYEVTGLVPQLNWNNTIILSQWSPSLIAGSQANIASPVAHVLTTSAGAASPMQVSWSARSGWLSGNHGGVTQRLLDAALWADQDVEPVNVTFTKIPYAKYDVILYVGSNMDGRYGRTRLNNAASSDRWFASGSAAPETQFIEPRVNNKTRPWRGNVIRYRNVTGTTCNVKLFREPDSAVGLHAVQIVNATLDSDNDGIPDWWEVANQTRLNFPDSEQDPDFDQLSNYQEYLRGTDPRNRDTDGDGLSDYVETNTRVFKDEGNTGSDPLNPDTDGDGLNDGAELALKPVPTNPCKADTDGDGRSDKEEVDNYTNPAVANAANFQMPVVSTGSPRSLTWDLVIQLVWDHTRALTEGGTYDRDLFSAYVRAKPVAPFEDAFNIALRTRGGHVTWYFHSSHNSAFSDAGAPLNDIYASDWTDPPADLTKALGFSGRGTVDISARLRFRLSGSCPSGSASKWNITFSVINLDTNQTVATMTRNNVTLASLTHQGRVTWANDQQVNNRLSVVVLPGVQLFMLGSTTAGSIESTSAFQNYKDSDNDGMPDVWEIRYGFKPNDASDAAGDADNDGLTNVREYEAGTHPRKADSDGDGVNDGIEVDGLSNPLLASSVPQGYNGTPAVPLPSQGLLASASPTRLQRATIDAAMAAYLGLSAANANGDDDHDGMLNWQEAVAGTDAHDERSRLWATTQLVDGHLVVSWPRILNKRHQLQGSSDFVTWQNITASPVVKGTTYQVSLPVGSALQFFRVGVDDVDSDGDGVSDWTEANITHTSIHDANSSHSPVQQGSRVVPGDFVTMTETFGQAPVLNLAGSPTATSSISTTASTTTRADAAAPPPSPPPVTITKAQAARFLMQASFGPTLEEIENVQRLGYEGWIDSQFAVRPTLHSSYVQEIFKDFFGPRANLSYSYDGNSLWGTNLNTAFARAAISGRDQLRQRLAFALSQILVTSRKDDDIRHRLRGMASYYDIFVRNAFGRYEDVVMEVSLHPCMGDYLSHVGNQKADPSINRYPDENYAREIMQLFTIGLWRLNADGSRQQDLGGHDIPTYGNTEITQLARVFTGLWYGGQPWGDGGYSDNDFAVPMTMNADRHDFGAKTLFDGYVIPARPPTTQDAMRDISDAVHFLARHANTAPFVGRELIQFFVTDNPSAAYIQRVATVWLDNGSGVRGDLKAVIKAVLLDDEARNPIQTTDYGRLKEPTIRAMAMARAFNMKGSPSLMWWGESEFYESTLHEPTYSPSVFNFYRPDYAAPGAITTAQKRSPVFQITNSFTAIASANMYWDMIERGFSRYYEYDFPFDLSRETTLAADTGKLLDYLNLIFCAGGMSTNTRTTILNAIDQIPASQPEARARVAAYLTIVSPEGAVLK